MYFQQIRNATVKIEYAGKKFLVDPWLSAKDAYPPIPHVGRDTVRNPIVGLPVTIEELLAVDAVLVTHTHFDHFDETARGLLRRDMKIFVQDAVDEAEMKGYGFTNTEILAAAGSVFAGIVLHKTNCAHGVGRATEETFAGMGLRKTSDACGVVFSNPEEKTLYLAGDTIWFAGVQQAIAIYQPEIIVLNTAQAEFPKGHPIIMGLADLQAVCEAAPSAQIIASHMGAVSHAQLTRRDIHVFLEQRQISNVWVPEDGAGRHFL